VVSVPFASATDNADRAFRAFMVSMIAVFAAVFLALNALLYLQLLRPVRKIARIADQLSLGDESAEEFPRRGAAELLALSRSFDRMRKSLEKALRLLGS
jgi:HAMP domain-containing protein